MKHMPEAFSVDQALEPWLRQWGANCCSHWQTVSAHAPPVTLRMIIVVHATPLAMLVAVGHKHLQAAAWRRVLHWSHVHNSYTGLQEEGYKKGHLSLAHANKSTEGKDRCSSSFFCP